MLYTTLGSQHHQHKDHIFSIHSQPWSGIWQSRYIYWWESQIIMFKSSNSYQIWTKTSWMSSEHLSDIYIGQFLQDGKNVRFMSSFFWKVEGWCGQIKRYWWLLSIFAHLSWLVDAFQVDFDHSFPRKLNLTLFSNFTVSLMLSCDQTFRDVLDLTCS